MSSHTNDERGDGSVVRLCFADLKMSCGVISVGFNTPLDRGRRKNINKLSGNAMKNRCIELDGRPRERQQIPIKLLARFRLLIKFCPRRSSADFS